ncbi:MAG TPA: alpha/beta hydrolase [Acidimicrobiales bacterium]|nr:alpha/beta hydrolase [Acidimicrobiales bacterium]
MNNDRTEGAPEVGPGEPGGSGDSVETVILPHMRVELALHRLSEGGRRGRALLLLHGLGEATPSRIPSWAELWPGPVWGLDFTGHGSSTVPRGGGYTPEVLMSDADAALGHLGEATLAGRGLGAYVALQLAGARPREVRGAVLADGPGFYGGGVGPADPMLVELSVPGSPHSPDPWALVELAHDIRPADYAGDFVRQAAHLSGLEQPVTVCASGRPKWLAGILEDVSVKVLDPRRPAEALRILERHGDTGFDTSDATAMVLRAALAAYID